jgi:hypothetical protein
MRTLKTIEGKSTLLNKALKRLLVWITLNLMHMIQPIFQKTIFLCTLGTHFFMVWIVLHCHDG